MKKVRLDLAGRSYNILIGSGTAAELPRQIHSMAFHGPVVIITDKIVMSKTNRVVAPVFKTIENEVIRVVVPGGERSKSIEVFQDTIHEICKKTKKHHPLVVALGGGVVGDLGGFVAATYRRGVPLIHLPTTLLAQVDSAIGGKVGVDLPEAKNLVGAFYQPKAVLIDTDFLHSLPRRQIKNGMAEIIKYAIIKSRPLFEFLEDNMEKVLQLKKRAIERVIHECVAIKARVVEKDELDRKDVRIALNFGHTLGHAIEAASGYSESYNHGEAVALGMILAGAMAFRLDMLKEKDLERIKDLIKSAGLPVKIRGVTVRDIMNTHVYDKKFVTGSNRFVLPKRIGSVEVVEGIPELLVKTVLKNHVE
ncbi:MAG: 3-dehydroquinate synthase [Candidatus Omnitrophota bacterium]